MDSGNHLPPQIQSYCHTAHQAQVVLLQYHHREFDCTTVVSLSYHRELDYTTGQSHSINVGEFDCIPLVNNVISS